LNQDETLILIKPDGIKRGLIGKIISRFEEKGFVIGNIKYLTLTDGDAKVFYSSHQEKPFFNELVQFITSAPLVACVLKGSNAINVVRTMIGSTKAFEAIPGTIRGDFGLGITDNLIHASDSVESFIKESHVIFG
jgi:nucleoside-diphosphate kinase